MSDEIAKLSLALSYPGPGGESRRVPTMAIESPFQAISVGRIDIDSGSASGTAFDIPFGSIGVGASAVLLKNGNNQDMALFLAGVIDEHCRIAPGGVFMLGGSTAISNALTQARLELTADQTGDGFVDFWIFGDASTQPGVSLGPVDLKQPLVIAGNRRVVADATALSSDGRLVLALASSGHKRDGGLAIEIPAGTVTASGDGALVRPPDWNVDGWDSFDPALGYSIFVLCTDDTPGAETFRSSGVSEKLRDTSAPTISTLVVDSGDADKLVVTYSEACTHPAEAITGYSLLVNVGAAATLTGLVSGNGTTIHTHDISRDVVTGDDLSLVIGSSRTLQDLNGNKIAAGTHAIDTSSFGGYDFGATTGMTMFFDPAADPNNLVDAGAVTAITTSGGAVSFTGTGTYRATGLGGLPGVQFTAAASDVFNTATILSALLSAGEFYLAMVVQHTTITTDASGGSIYANQDPICDVAGYWGLACRLAPSINSFVFDGSSYKSTSLSIVTGAPTLHTMRLKSGTLFLGVDGTEDAGTACGNVDAPGLAATLRLGRGPSGGIYWLGLLGHTLICNADPGATERGAVEAALKSLYGIA